VFFIIYGTKKQAAVRPGGRTGLLSFIYLHNDSNSSFSFEESFWLEIKRQNDFI